MGDCERLHDGLLAEPVNTLSSLAYVAAGVYVFRRHDRLQGAALVALGVGSVAYHAVGGSVARVLHDASIVAVAGAVAFAAPRIWRGTRSRPTLAVGAVALFGLALPLQIFGRTGGPLCAPDSLFQAHAGWHVLTAAALAATCVLAASWRRRDRGARRDRPPHARAATRW
jgi:hypothetical protein